MGLTTSLGLSVIQLFLLAKSFILFIPVEYPSSLSVRIVLLIGFCLSIYNIIVLIDSEVNIRSSLGRNKEKLKEKYGIEYLTPPRGNRINREILDE
jgi:hypothetical protein